MSSFFGVFCPFGDASVVAPVKEMTAAVKGRGVITHHSEERLHEPFALAVQTRIPQQTAARVLLSSGYDSTAVATFAANHLMKENKRLYGFASVSAVYVN